MNRVAVIGGARTPFVKAGGALAGKSFLDLGIHSVKSLVEKLKLKDSEIDEIIYSTVLLDPRMPNAARELVIRSGLSPRIPAHFISNNCISGLVAANMAVEAIRSGRIRTAIVGGSESMSRPALSLSRKAENFWLSLSRARTAGDKVKTLLGFRPAMIAPLPPSPKEPSTGLTMGQHCEISAKEFGIGRERQDELAERSHLNAGRAQQDGIFAEEIAALDGVDRDNLVRGDTSRAKLAKLRPVFDPGPLGTLTAGNSSALTDGASAVCLMSEEEAKRQGREVLGFIDACEFAALHPNDGLLMAPGIALPRLLHGQGLGVADIDCFEIHEAFAAQVLANMEIWEKGWAKFPEIKAIGRIPTEKINQNGGSLAIGHPFAATGGRLILSAVNNLKRRGLKTAAISVCAAGGAACAMLIRR